MPNYVMNELSVKGDSTYIREMLESIKNDIYGTGSIDFNKIIPMPSALDTTAGNAADKGLRAYKDFYEICTLMGTVEVDISEITEEAEDRFLQMRTDVDKDTFALGKKAFLNEQEFGFSNWYDWCVANWGTKWNACGYEDGVDKSTPNTLRFLTAYGPPHPVIAKLAAMYPDLDFVHEWAEEQLGVMCGHEEYSGGNIIGIYFPATEKENIEFAARLWDIDPEDNGLCLNASETRYIHIDDDGYELITIGENPALYTPARLSEDDIPKGLNCYQVRMTDDGVVFGTLEPKVSVNFGGSIIVSEPLDFGEKGYIDLTGDMAPAFMGISNMTFEEYMNGGEGMTDDMSIQ